MMQPVESILVPTDGSDEAQIGASRGIQFAAITDAEFHVLSVLNIREIEAAIGKYKTEREQILESAAKHAVGDVKGTAMKNLSGKITGTVERGVPHKTINEYVQLNDIDLIVMGTTGRSGVQRLLLGSVAEKTLRTAKVPVLLVPPAAAVGDIGEEGYERILLPTDGSEGAEQAVDWGVSLANDLDAMIHSIYSVETGPFDGLEGAGEIYEELEQTGEDALKTVRDRAQASGISVSGNVTSGPAARTILNYSDKQDIDLIVMGTHGRSGLNRYLIGSVTETVVRNADVPVCCVPLQ